MDSQLHARRRAMLLLQRPPTCQEVIRIWGSAAQAKASTCSVDGSPFLKFGPNLKERDKLTCSPRCCSVFSGGGKAAHCRKAHQDRGAES